MQLFEFALLVGKASRISATRSSCFTICSRNISTGVFFTHGLRPEGSGAGADFCGAIAPPCAVWVSADIQAVVAADYIRNLREETKKGLYGRLKQGFYPLRAPIGYRDNGAAKPKTIDPAKGPLVRKAFHLYTTGQWSIPTLVEEMYRRGLRNHAGGKVTRNGMHSQPQILAISLLPSLMARQL